MNFKKAFFCVSFGFLGATALSLSFFNTRALATKAYDGKGVPTRTTNYDDSSFSGEAEIGQNVLKVGITSSSKTTLGQSFNFYFSTGGTGYQDATKTFTVAPNDSSFETYYNDEFSQLTDEQKEEIEELYEKGEYQTKQFVGQLYSLNYQADKPTIYIPRTLSRGVFFQFKITEIATAALTKEVVDSGVTTVYIPSTVDTIYSSTFTADLPSNFVFNVELQQSEIPETWEAGWNHGATVNYGVAMTDKQANVRIAGSSVEYGDKENNFMIGYYPETGTQYPLVISYKLQGGDEVYYYEFSKSTTSSVGSIYDAVGYKLYGFSNNLTADLAHDFSQGGEVDYSSVVVHNIFAAKQESVGGVNQWVPDTTQAYYSNPTKSFSKTLNISDLIKYEFEGISTFSGYTAVDLKVDQAGDEVYQKMKSSFYKQYASGINSGKIYIRYRFTSLNSCKYHIVYNEDNVDVEKTIQVKTPINNHALSSKTGNSVSFLFKNSEVGKGFSASSIRELSFISFYVTLDLYDRDSGVVARSGLSSRFGYFMVMPYQNNASLFNIDLMLIIMAAAYTVGYAGLAVGAFFYFKNKEFRRVKPKAFWIKAVLGLIGSFIVILFLTFVIIRFTAFNNAIVVYNPVDAFIIVTAVASILIIGYFIKYLVTISKANKARKRILKLKLNEDVDDDGTK